MNKITTTQFAWIQVITPRARDFAIKAHRSTNHMYDEYIDYEFHLRMVVRNGEKFIELVPAEYRDDVIAGCWVHDVIEDTRENYNAVKNNTSEFAAEIARACTNLGRGRNREERMPDWIYADIKATPYATFVKLCDRMANGQYSKMTGSSMYEKYQKEHEHFKEMLYVEGEVTEMWNYLEEIFGIK